MDLTSGTAALAQPAPYPDSHMELPAVNTAYTGRPYRFAYGCRWAGRRGGPRAAAAAAPVV